MRSVSNWLDPRLVRTAKLVGSNKPVALDKHSRLHLGIDLGTSDIVSIVLDSDAQPVAVRLNWADVVRDGIVWDFFGAVTIVRQQLEELGTLLGERLPTRATTSFPPGTDPRISVNVIEAAGLEVAGVIDEPSAVADLLELDKAAVVDIGGGTTGIAVVEKGKVVYSGDEPTGGHHVSLTLAGNQGIPLEEAESLKKSDGNKTLWPIVSPVFDKMAEIVRSHLRGFQVEELYLSGGSCAMPGVKELFARAFPEMKVVLPRNPIFLTPLAIAAYEMPGKE